MAATGELFAIKEEKVLPPSSSSPASASSSAASSTTSLLSSSTAFSSSASSFSSSSSSLLSSASTELALDDLQLTHWLGDHPKDRIAAAASGVARHIPPAPFEPTSPPSNSSVSSSELEFSSPPTYIEAEQDPLPSSPTKFKTEVLTYPALELSFPHYVLSSMEGSSALFPEGSSPLSIMEALPNYPESEIHLDLPIYSSPQSIYPAEKISRIQGKGGRGGGLTFISAEGNKPLRSKLFKSQSHGKLTRAELLLTDYKKRKGSTAKLRKFSSFEDIGGKKFSVLKACVNCKRAHLACDNERPCHRCKFLGREASCVDVEHKKRGRPRSTKSQDFAAESKPSDEWNPDTPENWEEERITIEALVNSRSAPALMSTTTTATSSTSSSSSPSDSRSAAAAATAAVAVRLTSAAQNRKTTPPRVAVKKEPSPLPAFIPSGVDIKVTPGNASSAGVPTDDGSSGSDVYSETGSLSNDMKPLLSLDSNQYLNPMEIVSVITPEGKYKFMSKHCEALFGFPREYFLNRFMYEFVHEEDIEVVAWLHHEVMASKDKTRPIVYRARCFSGLHLLVELNMQPLTDKTQGIACYARVLDAEDIRLLSLGSSPYIADSNDSTAGVAGVSQDPSLLLSEADGCTYDSAKATPLAELWSCHGLHQDMLPCPATLPAAALSDDMPDYPAEVAIPLCAGNHFGMAATSASGTRNALTTDPHGLMSLRFSASSPSVPFLTAFPSATATERTTTTPPTMAIPASRSVPADIHSYLGRGRIYSNAPISASSSIAPSSSATASRPPPPPPSSSSSAESEGGRFDLFGGIMALQHLQTELSSSNHHHSYSNHDHNHPLLGRHPLQQPPLQQQQQQLQQQQQQQQQQHYYPPSTESGRARFDLFSSGLDLDRTNQAFTTITTATQRPPSSPSPGSSDQGSQGKARQDNAPAPSLAMMIPKSASDLAPTLYRMALNEQHSSPSSDSKM